MAARLLALAAAVLLAVVLGGCDADRPRTSKFLLDRETAEAFGRAYDAARRMTTGRPQIELIWRARSRCADLAPAPTDDRDWLWWCRISYAEYAPVSGRASYLVRVDTRGCFTATSGDFPPRAFERVLRRTSPYPLARFTACP
jgi:hypothetical protein